MKYLELKVPGKIQGKQRARVTRWGAHTPKQTVLYENYVRSLFLEKFGTKYASLEGPVTLVVDAFFQMPKWSAKKKDRMRNTPCLKTPDGDNVLKSISDALNKIAYADDKQAYDMRCIKQWADEEYVVIRLIYEGVSDD